MKATTDTRERFEIIGTAKTGQTGTVIVAHQSTLDGAVAAYDQIVNGGHYRNVWVRRRVIVETVDAVTPKGFDVHVTWVRYFIDEPSRHSFLTREIALAFAQDGNDPTVIKSVHVFDHRQGATIWRWPEQ